MRAGLSVAGALPVALLLGLLTVPTECRCGAQYAHPHALFVIPSHNHVGYDLRSEPDRADEADADHNYVMTAGAPGLAGRTAVLGSSAYSFDRLGAAGERVILAGEPALSGVLDSPDPPPPRPRDT